MTQQPDPPGGSQLPPPQKSGFTAAPPPFPPRSIMTELPSRWPKPIGVINIIFGSLGLLGGAVGLAQMLLMPWFMSLAAQGQPEMAAQAQDIDWSIVMGPQAIVLGTVGVIWSIVLLSAGIMLLRRSRNARFANMLWATVRMFLMVAGIYLTLTTMPQWIEHLESLASQGNELAKSMLGRAHIATAIVTAIVLGLPYPLFIFIWFMRPKIEAECAEW